MSGEAITTVEALERLFEPVGEASLRKQVDFVHPVYRAMIEASPFLVLSTVGRHGVDASPRGDAPGFVRVRDERTLLLPERRGNNRVDSLRNLLEDPRVGMLFLIPGVGETLRVNGRARIVVEPALLQSFAIEGKSPKCVIEVAVEEVFFQCARAIRRSRLWDAPPEDIRERVPSAGTVLAALTRGEAGGEAYDRSLDERQKATLY